MYKVFDGKINEWEWKNVYGFSCFGPLLTIILIMFGIGYLLMKIPYWLIFGKEKDE